MPLVQRDPNERVLRILADFDRRLRIATNSNPETITISGPRDDDPSGDGSHWGPRVMLGLLDDGSYGIARWLQSGTRQVPTWS